MHSEKLLYLVIKSKIKNFWLLFFQYFCFFSHKSLLFSFTLFLNRFPLIYLCEVLLSQINIILNSLKLFFLNYLTKFIPANLYLFGISKLVFEWYSWEAKIWNLVNFFNCIFEVLQLIAFIHGRPNPYFFRRPWIYSYFLFTFSTENIYKILSFNNSIIEFTFIIIIIVLRADFIYRISFLLTKFYLWWFALVFSSSFF
jgi:hypothetical protein